MTENWKPAGVGGHSSRGWGAVVGGETVEHLRAVFDADTSWYDTMSWRTFRKGRSFNPTTAANETYPKRFPAERVPVDSVSVLTAPDDAETGVISLLRSANESVSVQQMTVGSIHQPFIRAALAAARRGVKVRVLLSSAWYVHDDNQRVVRWLNERADAEGLPLEAKLASPHGYEKIHAKGVIVDRATRRRRESQLEQSFRSGKPGSRGRPPRKSGRTILQSRVRGRLGETAKTIPGRSRRVRGDSYRGCDLARKTGDQIRVVESETSSVRFQSSDCW